MTQAPSAPAPCDDEDLAAKSFFLGPCAENGEWLKFQLESLLKTWFEGRRRISEQDGSVIPPDEAATTAYRERQESVAQLARALSLRFENELPKFSPRYLGHMFSELSLPALVGHWVALLHNPNNISRESSLVGLAVEREAIAMLMRMFGYDPNTGAGHFTSGGTLANFEAFLRARSRQRLWVALGCHLRRVTGKGPTILEASCAGWHWFEENLPSGDARSHFLSWADAFVYSENFISDVEAVYGERWRAPALAVSAGAHYSWAKAADFFGLPREAMIPVPLDDDGRMCRQSLEEILTRLAYEKRPLQMIVTLAGSTELGSVDPIGAVQDLLDATPSFRFSWHHVDAAFGGFFASVGSASGLSPDTTSAFRSIPRTTSLTVDPHKLGYVPYASGVFLCRDRRDYPHHKAHAPYVDFIEGQDPGLYTIEGSRAATGAAATWLTGRSIGFDEGGYGRILDRTLLAKTKLSQELSRATESSILMPPGLDLNILCFALRSSDRLSDVNRATRALFALSGKIGLRGYSISHTSIRLDHAHAYLRKWLEENRIVCDDDSLDLIRLCLMNPFVTSRHATVDFLSDFAAAVAEAQQGLE